MKGFKSMDLGRKIRIILGVTLVIISAFTGGGLVVAGLFIAITGIFNLCPTCIGGSCSTGSCEIEPASKEKTEEKS
jgi:hypothetical protein